MSRDFFTPAERAALDRATAPALPAGFADALLGTAMARAHVPPRRPIGFNWRGWRRHTRMLFGFGALAVAGATAAAAGGGLFERLPERLPQFAAAVGLAPAPPAPKHVAHVHRPRPADPAPTPAAVPDDVAQAVSPSPLTDEQIARRRARVAAYRQAVLAGEAPPLAPMARRVLARRVQKRIANLPPERRAELQARFAAMTPEQQARVHVAMEVRFLANHPQLAERLRERGAVAPLDTRDATSGEGSGLEQSPSATPQPADAANAPQPASPLTAQR